MQSSLLYLGSIIKELFQIQKETGLSKGNKGGIYSLVEVGSVVLPLWDVSTGISEGDK